VAAIFRKGLWQKIEFQGLKIPKSSGEHGVRTAPPKKQALLLKDLVAAAYK
jgi:hypothetical protein